MTKSLFQFDDYREYLKYRQQISPRKHGELSRLAEAAGCQRPYLSQVIHGSAQLTPDHACALADHWHLPPLEHRYFCLLVDGSRAGTPRLQQRIAAELKSLKEQSENLAQRFEGKPKFSLEEQQRYFSAWHWTAIHLIVSIPQYRQAPAIAERLALPVTVVEDCLEKLRASGLVERKNGEWIFGGGNMHLPKDSPLTFVNHTNWRTRAVQTSPHIAQDIHYTSAFSLSQKDFEKLKAKILSFLDECRAVIGPSKEEELVAMNLDFFVV